MSVTLAYLGKSAEGDAEKCPHNKVQETDQQLIQMIGQELDKLLCIRS